MNQKEFISDLPNYVNFSPRLLTRLLIGLKRILASNLVSNTATEFPRLGAIFVQAQDSKMRYDFQTGTSILYPAQNVVKMRKYSAAQQIFSPSWRIYENYEFYVQHPDSPLGIALAVETNSDLLTCNQFIDAFVSTIIDGVFSDDKVVLANIGTFKKTEYTIVDPDPVSPKRKQNAIASNTLGNNWVTVGRNDQTVQIMQSDDALNWNNVTSTLDNLYTRLAYADDLAIFCAVGLKTTTPPNTMAYATSSNGTTWTESSNSLDISPECLIYAGATRGFFAGGFSATKKSILRSTNGTTWTEITMSTLSWIMGIAYSDSLGIYVAVGFAVGTTDRAYSTDGSTWTNSPFSSRRQNDGVVWSESLGLFIAWANWFNGPRFTKSSDGINWSTLGWNLLTPVAAVAVGEKTVAMVFFKNTNGVTIINAIDKKQEFLQVSPFLNMRARGADYNAEKNIFTVCGDDINLQHMAYSQGGARFWDSRTITEPKATKILRPLIIYHPSIKLTRSVN